MNLTEAKNYLQLYRPGAGDDRDPQVAAALALAKSNPALAASLEAQTAGQTALRDKFRAIEPPAGLKEQIISEHAAGRKAISRRRALALAATAAVIVVGAGWWLLAHPPAKANDLAIYRARMVRAALTGYAMDLETNNLARIRAYLSQKQAPSDFRLPAGLERAAVAGCAIEPWQGAKVTLVCFRTGKPLRPGVQSDLWLFVIDRASLKNATASATPALAKVNRLMTATWAEGNNFYLLGVAGDEQTIRSYL